MRFRAALSALVALLLMLIGPFYGAQYAWAHDKLLRSLPLDGSTVRTAPKVVTLYFEEAPGDGFSSLTVTAPDGSAVAAGPAVIYGSQMSVPLRALTARGSYAIKFAIVSDDGHPVSGVLHFTYRAGVTADSAASTQMAVAHKSEGAGAKNGLAWIALAAAALAVLTIANAVRRRSVARMGRPNWSDQQSAAVDRDHRSGAVPLRHVVEVGRGDVIDLAHPADRQ
jgi:copper resistance protein C